MKCIKKAVSLLTCLVLLFSLLSALGACGNATFKVTFDTDGGSQIEEQYVNSGEYAVRPAQNPTKAGYEFDDWYYKDNVLWNFGTYKITKDTVITAKWNRINTYTVSFDSDGGSAVSAQTVNEGAKATKPTDPARTGYNFIGWYNGDFAFDFNNTAITRNITLKARWEAIDYNCEVFATAYTEVRSLTSNAEIASYANAVKSDGPVSDGIIASPYYTATVNGATVPVYAARTTFDIHSFCYLDVSVADVSKPFYLSVTISATQFATALRNNSKVTVLPESKGVIATVGEKTVSCTISSFGSYSFSINNDHFEPITLFVTEKEDTSAIFGDKTVTEIQPGDYTSLDKYTELKFNQQNTVYYFKAGRYDIDQIILPSNSVLYLERGAYLTVHPSKNPLHIRNSLLTANDAENVTVYGRGLFDMSPTTGSGDWQKRDKGGMSFARCSNVEFSGITMINSSTWTLCFTGCSDVHVKNIFFLGYRECSDGVMLSNCNDSVVEDSFIRTGDDAFEVKSTADFGLTDNVLFQNNACWTDRARAYGSIYESNLDTRNVTFKNNSVGFALADWSDALGCCVVNLGDHLGTNVENIRFENIEIFHNENPAVLNVYIDAGYGKPAGGFINNIYFKNITAKKNTTKTLLLHTFSSDRTVCEIKNLYLDDVYSNGIKIEQNNYTRYWINDVAGGYDTNYLHINTLGD